MAARKSGQESDPVPGETRTFVARGFSLVEDVMYIGLGLLLSAGALSLLANTVLSFAHGLWNASLAVSVVSVLDRVLLMLMIVELLYTVQVSFREHALVPEPFLVVGLVAAIWRVLVLTAELTSPERLSGEVFKLAMIELGVLTAMIITFVVSLLIIRGRAENAVATRA